MRKILLVMAVLWLIAVSVVAAAPPDHNVRWVADGIQRQKVVEQQTPGGATQPDSALWIVNPTTCVWDVDEYDSYRLGGKFLQADETVSVSDSCVIGDWTGHLFVMWVEEGLRAEVSVGERTWARDGPGYLCLRGPGYGRDNSVLQPIPGSNGGVGVQLPITFAITNMTSKKFIEPHATATVRVHSGPYVTDICPVPPYAEFDDWFREHGEPSWSWMPPTYLMQ